LRQIAEWNEACEAKFPEPDFITGELPEWVQRLSREVVRTLFPEAKFEVSPEWTARELGAVIGHQLAFCHALSDLPKLPVSRSFRKLDKKVRVKTMKQIKRFAKCRTLAVERSLALASRQSYAEAAEFFTAFTRALNRKPSDAAASNFHRTNTKVYWMMLVGWRSVERLRSVRELQQGLCKYLEPHVVGDIKRIEKMCQRLGLHFGRRGRPRKDRRRECL
jgi:hypothetical protein